MSVLQLVGVLQVDAGLQLQILETFLGDGPSFVIAIVNLAVGKPDGFVAQLKETVRRAPNGETSRAFFFNQELKLSWYLLLVLLHFRG